MTGPTVHLIGLGRLPARPVRDLRPGDRVVFNYGYLYSVVAVDAGPGAPMVYLTLADSNGARHVRRKRPGTLMAVCEGPKGSPAD